MGCTIGLNIEKTDLQKQKEILISDFRRDLNVENVLLGISPASICSWPTFRNAVSVPSSKAGGRLWDVRGSKV